MNTKQNFDVRDIEPWWRTGQESYQKTDNNKIRVRGSKN